MIKNISVQFFPGDNCFFMSGSSLYSGEVTSVTVLLRGGQKNEEYEVKRSGGRGVWFYEPHIDGTKIAATKHELLAKL